MVSTLFLEGEIINSIDKARLIANLALEKKGEDVVIMDLRGVAAFSDFFVIITAGSSRRSNTIADHIAISLKDLSMRVSHIEGERDSSWVLIDCWDVIAHVFNTESRGFYALERVWNDSPKEIIAGEAHGSSGK